jgi:hypothetical protein
VGLEDFVGYGAYLITPKNQLIDCEFRTHEFWIEENQDFLASMGVEGVGSGEQLARRGWAHITLMGNTACLSSSRVTQGYFEKFVGLVSRLVEGGAPFQVVVIGEGENRGWKIPVQEFIWMEKIGEMRRCPLTYVCFENYVED